MSDCTVLVGPVPSVSFYGGPDRYRPGIDAPKIGYVIPTSTRDPRFAACTEHHVACDCREAELAEEIAEFRTEYRRLRDLVYSAVEGHRTWPVSADGQVHHVSDSAQSDPDLLARYRYIGVDITAVCSCPICSLIRKAHLW